MFSKSQNLEEYSKIGLTKLSNTFSCRSTGMFKFLVHIKESKHCDTILLDESQFKENAKCAKTF
jgi:thymidine kinase